MKTLEKLEHLRVFLDRNVEAKLQKMKGNFKGGKEVEIEVEPIDNDELSVFDLLTRHIESHETQKMIQKKASISFDLARDQNANNRGNLVFLHGYYRPHFP